MSDALRTRHFRFVSDEEIDVALKQLKGKCPHCGIECHSDIDYESDDVYCTMCGLTQTRPFLTTKHHGVPRTYVTPWRALFHQLGFRVIMNDEEIHGDDMNIAKNTVTRKNLPERGEAVLIKVKDTLLVPNKGLTVPKTMTVCEGHVVNAVGRFAVATLVYRKDGFDDWHPIEWKVISLRFGDNSQDPKIMGKIELPLKLRDVEYWISLESIHSA